MAWFQKCLFLGALGVFTPAMAQDDPDSTPVPTVETVNQSGLSDPCIRRKSFCGGGIGGIARPPTSRAASPAGRDGERGSSPTATMQRPRRAVEADRENGGRGAARSW